MLLPRSWLACCRLLAGFCSAFRVGSSVPLVSSQVGTYLEVPLALGSHQVNEHHVIIHGPHARRNLVGTMWLRFIRYRDMRVTGRGSSYYSSGCWSNGRLQL
ncbi:hypothetical protein V8C44DRAFT_334618 [Trichoderma aethiopicum]